MATSVLGNLVIEDSFDVSFFKITKWILGIIGFWPQDSLDRKAKIKVFFNLTFLLTAIIGESRFAYLIRSDPLSAFDVICPCLTKTVTWIKLVCFLIYRKDLDLILKRLFEHCKTDTKNIEKNNLITKVSHFTMIWCKLLYLNALSALCLFAVKPLLVWGYQYLKNGNSNTWVDLPFPAALPYEDMTRINSKALYSIIYCLLVHSGTINILGVCGTDGTFLCFCMYISVAYQCLQEDYKQSFKTHLSQGSYPTNDDVLYNKLSDFIRRQQNITEIFKSFNHIYKLVVFVHFSFASILLGIALVNIRLISGFSKLIYLVYAIGAANQLFIYCYGAESVNKNIIQTSGSYFSILQAVL